MLSQVVYGEFVGQLFCSVEIRLNSDSLRTTRNVEQSLFCKKTYSFTLLGLPLTSL